MSSRSRRPAQVAPQQATQSPAQAPATSEPVAEQEARVRESETPTLDAAAELQAAVESSSGPQVRMEFSESVSFRADNASFTPKGMSASADLGKHAPTVAQVAAKGEFGTITVDFGRSTYVCKGATITTFKPGEGGDNYATVVWRYDEVIATTEV